MGDRGTSEIASAPGVLERPRVARHACEIALLLALGALLLLPGLGGYPLLDPSEGRPAAIARQMALHESWLVPVLHGARYSDKPAPFYWLLWASSHLPISAEAAARLPSALATLVTALLLYRHARPRLGSACAVLGAIVFLTSPAIVGLGRFGTQDALLTALVTAATLRWLGWVDHPRSIPWVAYGLMGLGALVKGPVAIVLPLLAAAACAASRGVLRARLRAAGLVHGLGLSAGVLLAWLGPAAIADPSYAWGLVVDHHLRRYLTGAVGHPKPTWFLLPALAGLLLPWSLLLPALLRGRSSLPRPSAATAASASGTTDAAPERAVDAASRRAELDLLLWAGAVVAFFSLGQAKLATYVLPAVPPLALWIGARLVRLARLSEPARSEGRADPSPASVARSMRRALAVWAIGLGVAPVVAWSYLHIEFPRLAGLALLAWPLPAIAWIGLRAAWREPRRLRSTALVFALGNASLVLLTYLVGAPQVSRIASDAAIARAAAELAPGIPIVGFRIQPSSLDFYASAPVTKLKDVDEVLRRARGGPLVLVAREEGAAALRQAGLELYPWSDCVRHCLYGTVPRPELAIGRASDDRGPSS